MTDRYIEALEVASDALESALVSLHDRHDFYEGTKRSGKGARSTPVPPEDCSKPLCRKIYAACVLIDDLLADHETKTTTTTTIKTKGASK
jgi:hypothetical protein